ncbi:hypothetical protein IIZ77_01455 [Candidatus Saccharibacteria bacterium]|nr:hypothetical protein [Candidatus Saccharibacteria bacterium]
MFDITAKARASEVRQVWTEIEQTREEILEEEEAFLDGKTEAELVDFWEKGQAFVFERSKRVARLKFLGLGCYAFLQTLTGLAILMVMLLFIVSAFVDLNEVTRFAGKVALALFYAGLCVTAVAAVLRLGQARSEGTLRYRIAIQKILAEDYNLTSDYSDDVNAYAVVMLAANDFTRKTATQVRKEHSEDVKEKYNSDEAFILGMNDEIANVHVIDFAEKPPGGESESSESDDETSE